MKQKLEQLGYRLETTDETWARSYLYLSDYAGTRYFDYMYYSDNDSEYDFDSGKFLRGEIDHLFAQTIVSMEKQLALSKTIIETDLNVSLPGFVEQLVALLKEKSSLLVDQSVMLEYSIIINGITLDISHHGYPPHFEDVNIKY